MDIINGHPNAKQKISKPNTLEKMIELANQLSTGIPQLRVDFYEVNGKTYFGELTFFHHSGMVLFEPEEWDEKIGKMINLAALGAGASWTPNCCFGLVPRNGKNAKIGWLKPSYA